ncbi:MAG: prepilin peptidase [Planctomycetaceae bacterium]|nr:prepilin peptidase [Planctomycetaceae bacterium]
MLIVIAIVGLVLGRLAAGWASVLLEGMNSGGLLECASCRRPVSRRQRWLSWMPIWCECGTNPVRWHLASAVCLSALFAGFAWLLLGPLHCQDVTEVRPESLIRSRLPFHLLLLFLLWTATLTDLLDYVIPDEVTWGGAGLALLLATWSGDLQMMHLWVNWDLAMEGIHGPWSEQWLAWMNTHPHLHGLAWSLAGLTTGGLLTWLLRWVSQRLLGRPALGLGDATLMALAGAFLGWQATLCVLAIAPLTGGVIGVAVRVISGRGFVAYGPYLAASAVLVMSAWRWLWADFLSLRDIFSHWPSVLGLIGFAFGTLSLLLLALRVFRSITSRRDRR